MQIEIVPIDDVIPHPNNERIHDERNLAEVAASIDEFGQQTPIVVDPKNRILKGNGTHAAMKLLGRTEIAIIRSDLEGFKAAQYRIMDNRSSDLSRFDNDALVRTIRALQEEEDAEKLTIGFDEGEIKRLIARVEGGADGEDPGVIGDTEFRVIVDVRDADEQAAMIQRLEGEGYECRPLMS